MHNASKERLTPENIDNKISKSTLERNLLISCSKAADTLWLLKSILCHGTPSSI